MKKSVLTLAIAICSMLIFAQTVSIQPSNNKIQYAGRMSFANANAPAFSMPGTSITVSFNGTGISATFTSAGTSYIYVIVDGNDNPYEHQVIPVAGNSVNIPLVSSLNSGIHTVKIVKSNEYDTKLTFLGFSVTGTGIVDAPARLAHKIEFYGDSNPSGWSAWDIRDDGHPELSGGYHTYPGTTARMLNAEYSNFSAGGWGTTPKTRRMDFNDAYNRIHIGERTSASNTWNFENNYWNFAPEVVVINLGANDYYNGATKEEIKAGWNQLVNSIRQHCPQAHIVMANSYGWAFNEPADYVSEFVDSRHALGDANVSFVKFPWLWSDYHAVINEHAGFANILASHIATVMGWQAPTPSPLSSFGKNGNVGNGDFESSLLEGFADGWRPFASYSVPEYITDPTNAYSGNSFIRCTDPSGVMHANDAAPGEVFEISVWMKALSGNQGRLKYEFRDQGQGHLLVDMMDATIGSTWQKVTLTTPSAPSGTWQINVILEGINGSSVDFDAVSMRKITSGSISVTGVSVSPNTANLVINETLQLSANVLPANASNKSISWSSNNSAVATVNSNGLVTALSQGTAALTATTNDGGFSATCLVTVSTGGSGNPTSMHIIDIIKGTQNAGGQNKYATATVFVVDDMGSPVENANVSGTFSGDFNETQSGTTGIDGSVKLVTWGKKKGTINFDFCVDNLQHNSLSYNQANNLITCTSGSKSALMDINKSTLPEVNFFPNPVNDGIMHIVLTDANANYNIEIYNSLGKLMKLTSLNKVKETTLDISDFEKGIYLFKVSNQWGCICNTVVVN